MLKSAEAARLVSAACLRDRHDELATLSDFAIALGHSVKEDESRQLTRRAMLHHPLR